MQAYLATRISPNISRTPEGFLIATAPIARSGWQDYKRSEIDRATNDPTIVRVFRPVSEVTHPKTLASGEGKPIVSPHPATFVSPDNWGWTAKGHVQNVRVGSRDRDGNVTLLADLHIQDVSLINKIAAGTRDLSCGYTYDLVTKPDGTYTMRNIKLNHVAVVEEGRAGTTQIMDSRMKPMTDEERETLLQSIAEGIDTLVRRAAEEEAGARVHSHAADSRRESEADFFDAARQFHRRDIKQGATEYRAASNDSHVRRAVDSLRELGVEIDTTRMWFEAHNEAGRKMRVRPAHRGHDGGEESYETLIARRRRELLGR